MSHHKHEWILEGADPLYEDSCLYIFEACEYSEERAAGTSERLDETFYETLYDCDASRCHEFMLDGIERDGEMLAEDRDGVVDFWNENELFEEIEISAMEKLLKGNEDRGPLAIDRFCGRYHVDTSTHYVTVEVAGDEYELRYTYNGTTVDEI